MTSATPAIAPADSPIRIPLALVLAAISGTMVFLSFPFSTEPASNIWVLGWFALVPYFMILRGRSGRSAFWLGFFTGFVTNFGGFWWISEVLRDFGHLPPAVTWPLTALNAAYQGLVFAIAGVFIARALRAGPFCIWRTAAIFTTVEWLFPMLFPWFLGNGQYRFLPAIQVAELGGVPAVTFVMVVANGLIHRLVTARIARQPMPWRPVAIPAAVVALSLVYGFIRVGMVESDMSAAQSLKLGLVEANIGIFEKEAKGQSPDEQQLTLHRNLLKHQTMSRELEQRGADVIIWPESSYFPLVEPWIKTTDDFLIGLSVDGRLLVGDESPRAIEGGSDDLLALHAVREDAWVAVGRGGRIVTSRGTTNLNEAPILRAATFLARDRRRPADRNNAQLDLLVAGDGGHVAVLPYPALKDGRILRSPGVANLRAVAAFDLADAVLVGDGGVIWRLSEGSLVTEPSGTDADLLTVAWSPSDATIWAAGAGGVVLRGKRGRHFEKVAGPSDQTIRHLVVDVDAQVWVATEDGVHVRSGDGWIRRHRTSENGAITAMNIDARGRVVIALKSNDGARLLRRATDDGWVDLPLWNSEFIALAPLPYVQHNAFPRDVRWAWQSRVPLPPLKLFDTDPMAELAGVRPRDLSPVQRGFTTPILFGGLTWSQEPGALRRTLYNTALMFDRDGRVLGMYDKVYLLAFGEYMPFGDMFPELYDMFPQAGRFTPGDEVRVFEFRGHRIGIMVCYEDILATFTNRLAREKPNIIINVTNDAWFGRTSEPHLHLALAVFRAVENRLVLVRSTNTGVSALIEPTGRITAQTRIDDPETLLVDAVLMAGGTLYSKLGHAFAWALFLWLVVPAVWRRAQRLRKRFA